MPRKPGMGVVGRYVTCAFARTTSETDESECEIAVTVQPTVAPFGAQLRARMTSRTSTDVWGADARRNVRAGLDP